MGSTMFLVEKASAKEDFIETMKYYMKMFDEGFENWRKKNWKTQSMNWDDGDFFKCSCPSGFKK